MTGVAFASFDGGLDLSGVVMDLKGNVEMKALYHM